MAAAATGPLQGFRILDVTHAAAGPFCGMLLADLGADVIKVEPPTGEMMRSSGPFTDDDTERPYGGRYANLNRNKRSIALDLADDADRETFLRLVETADGMVENFRAGVLDRLGVGWEVCRARNPRLVYASIRGFGDPRGGESPRVDWPAYDVVSQAMGGMVAMTGPPGSAGMRAGPGVGDLYPATIGALGVVSAILRAQVSGQGQYVDVSMVDSMMLLSEIGMMAYTFDGKDPVPRGNSVATLAPFDIYPTTDGACAIAAPTERHWPILCEAIGRPDLIDDERTNHNRRRVRNRAVVDDAVGTWAGARTTAEVADALGGKVPVGPVLKPSDWLDDPHVRGTGDARRGPPDERAPRGRGEQPDPVQRDPRGHLPSRPRPRRARPRPPRRARRRPRVSAGIDYGLLVGDDVVHGSLYGDPAVFDDEMDRIFTRGWVFVGHASEIPAPGDWVTRRVGREPVIMTRDRDAAVHVLANRCSHRGTALCWEHRGNDTSFRCNYHAWTFGLDGSLRAVPYPGGFDKDKAALGLDRPGQVDTYRGFVFANQSGCAGPLPAHLGDGGTQLIDRLCDLSPTGDIDVSAGWIGHAVDSNWKMWPESDNDGYHLNWVHASMLDGVARQVLRGDRARRRAGQHLADRRLGSRPLRARLPAQLPV